MRQLGGEAIYLSPAEVGLGKRESVPDVARVLCRYVDVIAIRTFSHQTLEVMASHSSVPVINALSDREYQVLRLIVSGKATKDIAAEMSLSVKTVSTYRSRILKEW